MLTITENPAKILPEQRKAILRQIGTMTILGVSGGRVTDLDDGVELPVDCGYRVRVRLHPADYYIVERVLVRGGKEFSKGTVTEIYCWDLPEAVWRAHAFRSYGEEWTEGYRRA